jgi:SAM-dependent methyltransferase
MSDASSRHAATPSARPALATWRRFSAAAPLGLDLPIEAASYGADIPTEATLRLLGSLEGKRVLDLGCGAGHAAVCFARQGAKVLAVDPSTSQLDAARDAAEQAEVRIELTHASPAELAFVRADAIDAVWSAMALAEAPDLDRVFRQVHRVLKPESPIVFSLPHPAFAMFDPTADLPLHVRRAYHDRSPIQWPRGDDDVVDHPRTIADVFTSLVRANFRVDTILEPEPPRQPPHSPAWTDVMAWVPATVIFRARKLGI